MSSSPAPPRRRVAVLLGGPSGEHDVSIASGLQVLDGLDARRWEAVPVHLTRDGRWQVGVRPEAKSLAAAEDGSAPPPAAARDSAGSALPHLAAGLTALAEHRRIDACFIALHGAVGEDGTIQALLELAGLPYTGSGVLASALAMDKVTTKAVYRQQGVPVARDRVVRRRDLSSISGGLAALAAGIAVEVGLPCVVKPVIGGSSVATRVASDEASLVSAIEEALGVDERALVETCLTGTELTCGVLGGGPHEAAQALPVTEIVPAGEGFFDFHAKYTQGACEEITPARIDEALTRRVQELALLSHEALGCEGLSRTDFILDQGEPVALETNTIPGMTATSLLPQAAAAAGLSFPLLLDRLLESALLRARAGGER
jgi:D-alanine-D-alanine ligase